jgi:homeobox protein cut-like
MDALAVAEATPPAPSSTEVAINGNHQEHSPEPENKFQKAIAAWRGMWEYIINSWLSLINWPGIDLSSLIPQLDSTATEIVTNQRDALVERKELAQKTKDFRKLDDTAKLSEFKSLLKCKSM